MLCGQKAPTSFPGISPFPPHPPSWNPDHPVPGWPGGHQARQEWTQLSAWPGAAPTSPLSPPPAVAGFRMVRQRCSCPSSLPAAAPLGQVLCSRMSCPPSVGRGPARLPWVPVTPTWSGFPCLLWRRRCVSPAPGLAHVAPPAWQSPRQCGLTSAQNPSTNQPELWKFCLVAPFRQPVPLPEPSEAAVPALGQALLPVHCAPWSAASLPRAAERPAFFPAPCLGNSVFGTHRGLVE